MVVKPVNQLKKQIQEMEEANGSLKIEIEQLKRKKKHMEAQLVEDKTRIKKLLSVKKKNKDAEYQKLESELLSAKAEIYTLRIGELQGLQNELKSTNIALGNSNNKCKVYEGEIISLRKKFHDMIKELAKVDTEKTQLAYEKQLLQKDLEMALTKQEKRRGTLETINPSFQEYIRVKRQLRETVEDKKKLQREIESVSPRRKPEVKYLTNS